MVQVGSQKIEGGFLTSLLYLACSEIWLNLAVDDDLPGWGPNLFFIG
jgi:hypothetical protein